MPRVLPFEGLHSAFPWRILADRLRPLPDAGHALEMIFADDDEYYDALVFDDLDSLGMEEPLEPLGAAPRRRALTGFEFEDLVVRNGSG